MSNRQGYKQTNVGEIPEEWKVVKVRDLGEVITGTTPRTAVKEYWGGPYPFVTPTDISETKYVSRTGRTVSSRGVEKGRLIPKDSVLVTCIASIGKIAMASQPSITNQQINAIICKPSVDPHYVYYAIDSKTHILRTWAGQTQKPIVKKSLFQEFPIALPPFIEQRGISRILSCVDDAIQKTNEVIEKTKMLKRGAMQKLFIQGVGHREFKETEIGKIPKIWKVMKLGDVTLRVKRGPSKKTNAEGRGLIYLTSGFIDDEGFLRFENLQFLDSDEIDDPKKYLLNSGDLLVNCVNSLEKIGKVAVFDGYENKKVMVGFNNFALTCKKDIVYPYYLKYFFLSNKGKTFLRSIAKAAVQQVSFSSKDLLRVKIPLPPLPEQKKLSYILSFVDEKISNERAKKEKLEDLKKGLMQVLLTGKVRVKVD